jgi:hypothetical protein
MWFLRILFLHCVNQGVPMNVQTSTVFVLPDGRVDRKNASLYTGLAVKTLAMHATRGTGPKYIKRGRVFYYIVDLDAWLRGGAERP